MLLALLAKTGGAETADQDGRQRARKRLAGRHETEFDVLPFKERRAFCIKRALEHAEDCRIGFQSRV